MNAYDLDTKMALIVEELTDELSFGHVSRATKTFAIDTNFCLVSVFKIYLS